MASWQTTILSVALHLTVKRMLARSDSVERTRRFVAGKRKRRMPLGCSITPVEAHAFDGEWVHDDGSSNERTLLYLPGGGFMLPASPQVPALVAAINRHAGTRGLLVNYRLAPEHPFPAGLQDCLAAYRHLLDIGCDAEQIVIAGDSAGGGLVLSTLIALRDDGDPLPAGAVLISPFTDFTLGGASRVNNNWKDSMLSNRGIDKMNDLYLAGAAPEHPLASPVYADFRDLPPILAQVGSGEILLDDTLRVARKARSQAVDFDVEIWDGVPHVWHLWPFLPEAQRAIAHIGAFIRERTQTSARTAEAFGDLALAG